MSNSPKTHTKQADSKGNQLMSKLQQIEQLATKAITKQAEQSPETTQGHLEIIRDLASEPETAHIVSWQGEPGPWGTWAGMNGTNVKVFLHRKDALCFYNDKRVEFILDARPDLTADELEADFSDEEREYLLREIQEETPLGQYDLRMAAVAIA